jgi:GNAT superfamily N-acetyltransferase
LCREFREDSDWTPELIEANLGNFFVEGEPVHGFVMALPYENRLLLTLIVVHKDFQRKGVATRLLTAMEEVAKAAELEGVMNFGPKTPEIRKLYDKLGYKETGKKEWPGLPDADILFKEV